MQRTKFFVILDSFLAFYPPNNPKNQNLEKKSKNRLEILSLYTGVTKMTIIWCMDPEILSVSDRIFCHFRSFFALLALYNPKNQNFEKNKKTAWWHYHFTHVCHQWQSYDVWFLRYGTWQTEFFAILDHFLIFQPTNNPKNQNFQKLKKTLGYIIILHMCTISGYYVWLLMVTDVWLLRHGAWQTEFFIILDHFLSFNPPNNPKNQNFKKMKKTPG